MTDNTTIIATSLYPLQIAEERLIYNTNFRIVPVETISNEPITAIEIHPIHSMYSVASDYIEVEHNMLHAETVAFEPPKQDCCPSSPDEVLTKDNCCYLCLSTVVCLGLILLIVSVLNR
jgi:hypothetical protein